MCCLFLHDKTWVLKDTLSLDMSHFLLFIYLFLISKQGFCYCSIFFKFSRPVFTPILDWYFFRNMWASVRLLDHTTVTFPSQLLLIVSEQLLQIADLSTCVRFLQFILQRLQFSDLVRKIGALKYSRCIAIYALFVVLLWHY